MRSVSAWFVNWEADRVRLRSVHKRYRCRGATYLLVLSHDVGEEVRVDFRVVAALLKRHAVHLAGLDVGGLICGINLSNHTQ